MGDTLILLKDADIEKLERTTFQLLNLSASYNKSADLQLLIERNEELNEVLQLCSKYGEKHFVLRDQDDIRFEMAFVGHFLERVACSKEWIAPHIKKRATDILIYSFTA